MQRRTASGCKENLSLTIPRSRHERCRRQRERRTPSGRDRPQPAIGDEPEHCRVRRPEWRRRAFRSGQWLESVRRKFSNPKPALSRRFEGDDDDACAVRRDGTRIVIVAFEASGQSRLWIRELASDRFQPLAGTEGASSPFWSPDSTMLGFIADGRLRTIPAAGGTPLTLSSTAFMPGTWNRQGQILFAPAGRSPLHLVAASGGESRPVTRLDTASG